MCVYVRRILDQRRAAWDCFDAAPPSPPPPPPADAVNTATVRNDAWRQRVRDGDTELASRARARRRDGHRRRRVWRARGVAERIAALGAGQPGAARRAAGRARGLPGGDRRGGRAAPLPAAAARVDAALHDEPRRLGADGLWPDPRHRPRGVRHAVRGAPPRQWRHERQPRRRVRRLRLPPPRPGRRHRPSVECHLLKSTGMCSPIDFAATLLLAQVRLQRRVHQPERARQPAVRRAGRRARRPRASWTTRRARRCASGATATAASPTAATCRRRAPPWRR